MPDDHVTRLAVDGPLLVFGGPYSNLQATRAVLAEAARRGIPPRRVICTGDIVAYGADAAACCDLVMESGIAVIAGNCEESHAHMVYDQLFGRDAQQRPQPQMVERFETSADGLTWRFTLREGLAFHDGAPVTAEDVVASLRRWAARDPHGRQIQGITESLAPEADGRSFTWRLRRPYALMLDALSKPAGNMPAIMPARIAATDPFTNIQETVGSGPFIFDRAGWIPGSRVVYRRNEAYRPRAEPASGTAGGKRVHVDRVEWLNIANAQTAALALMQNEVDFVETPGVDFLPQLRRRNVRIERINALGFQGMIRMNHLHPPFNDPRAREALIYLANQEEYLQAMFPDPSLYQVCHAFFVCGSPQETNAGVPAGIGRNMERARQLIRESGYDGRPIVIMDPTDNPFLHAATLVLAQQLQQAGMRVDVQAMDFATMATRRPNRRPPSEGGWHFGLTFWNGLGASDPVGTSVTQSFSTTTSMGRLTLNILLSFAQYEREIIGERIRDKVAASKARGMWMGGKVPLGYDIADRKLIANQPEAARVRRVFELFVETGSGVETVRRLQAEGVTAKSGRPLDKGDVYKILHLRTYIGEVTHKGNVYRGEHEAIVPRELWDRAHAVLRASPRTRAAQNRQHAPALLKGLIFGVDGRALSPTHCVKNGRLYRYYVAQRVLKGDAAGNDGLVRRVSAAEIEAAVVDQVRALLRQPEVVVGTWLAARTEAPDLKEVEVRDALARLEPLWAELFPAEQARLMRSVVDRVVVGPGGADIRLRVEGLSSLVHDLTANATSACTVAA